MSWNFKVEKNTDKVVVLEELFTYAPVFVFLTNVKRSTFSGRVFRKLSRLLLVLFPESNSALHISSYGCLRCLPFIIIPLSELKDKNKGLFLPQYFQV